MSCEKLETENYGEQAFEFRVMPLTYIYIYIYKTSHKGNTKDVA